MLSDRPHNICVQCTQFSSHTRHVFRTLSGVLYSVHSFQFLWHIVYISCFCFITFQLLVLSYSVFHFSWRYFINDNWIRRDDIQCKKMAYNLIKNGNLCIVHIRRSTRMLHKHTKRPNRRASQRTNESGNNGTQCISIFTIAWWWVNTQTKIQTNK